MSLNNEIIEDVKRVANEMNLRQGDPFSFPEYKANGGRFSAGKIQEGGTRWAEYCAEAGFVTKAIKRVEDDEYFEKLNKAFQDKGKKFPIHSELKKYGLAGVRRRWPLLKSFYDEAVKKGKIDGYLKKQTEISEKKIDESSVLKKDIKEQKREENISFIPAPPRGKYKKKWDRIDIDGFPYAPSNEYELTTLFSILCSQKLIPWEILLLSQNKGIDGVCFDTKSKQYLKIELKFKLNSGSWNHSRDEIDYVVCWENKWPSFKQANVIEISKLLKGNKDD